MTRLEIHYERLAEFEKLVSRGAVYDEEQNTLLIVSEQTTRAFVLKIGDLYPLSGLCGVSVIAIEPLEAENEIDSWNSKFLKYESEYTRIDEIAHLLY
jgi:hypothetical protein